MNTLFPIYVKLDKIQVLLVGAGPIGLEKLQAILKNSPEANVHIVAEKVWLEVEILVNKHNRTHLSKRSFKESDLDKIDLVLVASNNRWLNAHIQYLCRTKHILLNVADKPSLCDFYLGSVVQKGNLKIGISTNGKSPTIAKRLKEFLDQLIPEEIDETLALMGQLRDSIQGDFHEKVKRLNEHTKNILENQLSARAKSDSLYDS